MTPFRAGAPVPSVVGMEIIDIAPDPHRSPLESPRRRSQHPAARMAGLFLGGMLALYLVGRGVAEFFIVHYSDPASYRGDWGGPSLAGVFAVHSGPAAAIVAGSVIWLRRRFRGRRDAA
jgi:hypothetical protein